MYWVISLNISNAYNTMNIYIISWFLFVNTKLLFIPKYILTIDTSQNLEKHFRRIYLQNNCVPFERNLTDGKSPFLHFETHRQDIAPTSSTSSNNFSSLSTSQSLSPRVDIFPKLGTLIPGSIRTVKDHSLLQFSALSASTSVSSSFSDT